jgi:large subunit ribosomal protein L15
MTIELHNLKSPMNRKARKRLGRGNASGQGTYAGRGLKGQHSRSGGNTRPGFEGGRTTLIMQTPKMRGKGFRSLNAKPVPVSVEKLNRLPQDSKVNLSVLLKANIVNHGPVKIVGDGELNRKLQVELPVTESAKAKIEAAGGTVLAEVKATDSDKK